MSRIEGIGGQTDLLQQLLERSAAGDPRRDLPPARGFLDPAAREITNAEGASLFDARVAIRDSLAAALDARSADGGPADPASQGDALLEALRANGFDPEVIRDRLQPTPRGGLFTGNGADPRLGAAGGVTGPPPDPDELLQQLLAQLPPGSAVDREA